MKNHVEMPLVSAIIPVYNGELFLQDALKSVLTQGYPNLETIVVDDGSTDDSAAIVKAQDGAQYISQKNQGVAMARNTGIKAASGEIFAFLDQDDYWMANKLNVQVKYLRQNPEIGYVLAYQRIQVETEIEAPPWFPMHILKEDHVGYFPGTLLAWRWVFDQVGFYNPAMVPAENADWLARAEDHGIQKAVVSDVLLTKRIHNSNQSNHIGAVRSHVLKALKASMDRKRQSEENQKKG